MADYTDFDVTDLLDDATAAQYNAVLRSTIRGNMANTESLSAGKTLTDDDFTLQYINCNGAVRDVTLPAPAATNHPFFILNTTTAIYAITVKNSAGTIVGLLYPGDGGIFVSDSIAYRWINPRPQPVDGTVENGKFVVTISSNDLVVTIVDKAGNTPTATSPVNVWIDGLKRSVTSALSVTVADGADTFGAGGVETAAKAIDYFVYLSWRTASSAVVFGISRIPWATLYSHFSGTSTNATYAAFSTAPASTDVVVNIGRFRATLSAGAGYTWTSVSQSAPTAENTVQRPIFETSILTFLPVGTASSGTITTMGTCSGKYQLMGANLSFECSLAITTNGTGAGYFKSSLPFTHIASNKVIAGQETAATNRGTGGLVNTADNQVYWKFSSDGAYPGADGRTLIGGGIIPLI